MSEYNSLVSMYERASAPRPAPVQEPVESEAQSVDMVPDPLTTEQLLDDDGYRRDARVVINYLDRKTRESRASVLPGPPDMQPAAAEREMPPERVFETEQDYARELNDRYSMMNANLGSMVLDYSRLKDAPLEVLQAFHRSFTRYTDSPTEWKHFVQGAKNAALDPFNWLGLSFIGGAVSRGLTQTALKSHMRNRLMAAAQVARSPATIAAVEGALFMGSEGAMQEDLEAQAEQREYEFANPAMDAAMGGLFGGALGAGVTAVPYAAEAAVSGVRQLHEIILQGLRSYDPAAGGVYNQNGVGRFTDTLDEALNYPGSETVQAEYVSRNPVVFTEPVVSAEEIAARLRLPPAQRKRIEQAIGTEPLPAHVAFDHPDVQNAIRTKGVDLVRYIEPMDGQPSWTSMTLEPRNFANIQKQLGAVGDLTKIPIAHQLPNELLVEGTGAKARFPVIQSWGPKRVDTMQNIDTALAAHPDAIRNEDGWYALMQDTMGGNAIPAPPRQAIKYANDPQAIADKLGQLRPEFREAVDKGITHTEINRALYESGEADAGTTGHILSWAFLSRGAGPLEQESAYADIADHLDPFLDKAAAGEMTAADVTAWKKLVQKVIPAGAPGRSVIHNANALGVFLHKVGQPIESEGGKSALAVVHEMMANGASTKDIRRKFMMITNTPGIDNKVFSFAMLAAGRHDVLILDRIQARHLWDDGDRFDRDNIYDGYRRTWSTGKVSNMGIAPLVGGPRGLMIYEALESQLLDVIEEGYALAGRGNEGSIGRFHWESWVIEGNQSVEHGTLKSIYGRGEHPPMVTEGKPGTFRSGGTYIKEGGESRWIYRDSNGVAYDFSPAEFDEFQKYIKKTSNGIIPGGFKVSTNEDGSARQAPWFNDPRVNRDALDAAIHRFGSPRNGPESEVPVETSSAGSTGRAGSRRADRGRRKKVARRKAGGDS